MPKDRVEAVDRALNLLEAFQEPGEDLTLAELAQRTGLYKSTILRLAGSLQHSGFLLRGPTGTFRLGPSLWRLGTLYRRDFLPGERVRPILRDLAHVTGETASFYVHDGEERVCLYRSNAPRALRHHLTEGARLPLDRGAAGRLLSAFAKRNGPSGADIREAGYAVSLGERDPEIAALAVAVLLPDNTCAGAVTISGPVGRFTEAMLSETLPKVQQAARQIASDAGGTDPSQQGPASIGR
ncbi:MAG: IclR family transcriptional regulator [Pseudomonadota bacterium]